MSASDFFQRMAIDIEYSSSAVRIIALEGIWKMSAHLYLSTLQYTSSRSTAQSYCYHCQITNKAKDLIENSLETTGMARIRFEVYTVSFPSRFYPACRDIARSLNFGYLSPFISQIYTLNHLIYGKSQVHNVKDDG